MLSALFFYIIKLNVILLSIVMLSVVMLSVIMLSVVMLRVVMLSVIMLSVVMLSVVMLSVVVPLFEHSTLPRAGELTCDQLFNPSLPLIFSSSPCVFYLFWDIFRLFSLANYNILVNCNLNYHDLANYNLTF